MQNPKSGSPLICVISIQFLLQMPYYTSSLCYQYQPPASPGHYYSEEEQRGVSPPLEVSEGEDEYEDPRHSSFRKDHSESTENDLLTANPNVLKGILMIEINW